MRIRYENTIDDSVAFACFQFRNSPTLRRSRFFVVWVFPLVVSVPMTCFLIVVELYDVLALWALFVFAYVLLYPQWMRWDLCRQVRGMYMEGKNRGLLDWHELELTDSTLIHRCEVGESKIRLDAIERIVSDENHTFVYVSSVSAYTIPRASVIEGDHDGFVSAIQKKHRDFGAKVNDG